jgi:hypothetical protein
MILKKHRLGLLVFSDMKTRYKYDKLEKGAYLPVAILTRPEVGPLVGAQLIKGSASKKDKGKRISKRS